MSTPTIAISGIAGSFSEEAAKKYLEQAKIAYNPIYCTTALDTFKQVINGKSLYGVVPIENSVGGMVYETLYAMADFTFEIIDIIQVDVQQNLLAIPGQTLKNITQVVSHPQALAQCRHYLKRHWTDTAIGEYADTALAARDLRAGKLSDDTAVIASAGAAKLYDLDILEPHIQDLKFNTTAFLVFCAKPSEKPSSSAIIIP
ncbi:MAG: prephenate dehydratase [Candidatus Saccharimonadia bacterium]